MTATASCSRSCAARSPRRALRPYRGEPHRPLVRGGSRAGAPSSRADAPRTPLAGRRRRDRDRGCRRQPPRRAALGRAGPPLRDRQGRRLRHRRQRRLREPPPLRDLARPRHVVGHRCRVDQRHPRRARRRACWGAALRRAKPRARPPIVEVTAGARIVLSAHADGEPRIIRALTLDVGRDASVAATPIAPAAPRRRHRRRRSSRRERARANSSITARMASGVRTVDLPRRRRFPSRSAARAARRWSIDWAHEGVSGHHVDITEIDEARRDRRGPRRQRRHRRRQRRTRRARACAGSSASR